MNAARELLRKARAGEDITIDDKLSVLDAVVDVEWFRIGLKAHGLDTAENLQACARRRAELLRRRKS